MALKRDQPVRAPGRGVVLLAGIIGAAVWGAAWWLVLRPTSGPVGLAVPLGLIVLSTALALRLSDVRAETAALRTELADLRKRMARDTRDRAVQTIEPPPDSEAQAPAAEPPRQSALPLDDTPERSHATALNLDDLMAALEFPASEDDAEGLRALALARKHHRAGPVIQSAEDIMTLMAEAGVFTDDLALVPASAEAWRTCASGAGGPRFSELGMAEDTALAVCRERLSADTVFRDAAHHFLQRFDHLVSDLVPQMSDEAIADFGQTRSAKAFRVVGCAAGAFPVRAEHAAATS